MLNLYLFWHHQYAGMVIGQDFTDSIHFHRTCGKIGDISRTVISFSAHVDTLLEMLNLCLIWAQGWWSSGFYRNRRRSGSVRSKGFPTQPCIGIGPTIGTLTHMMSWVQYFPRQVEIPDRLSDLLAWETPANRVRRNAHSSSPQKV
jgi:hypothetical protein